MRYHNRTPLFRKQHLIHKVFVVSRKDLNCEKNGLPDQVYECLSQETKITHALLLFFIDYFHLINNLLLLLPNPPPPILQTSVRK